MSESEHLQRAGANVSVVRSSNCLLAAAITQQDLFEIRRFVQCGADLNAPSSLSTAEITYGASAVLPLHRAVCDESEAVCRLLLELGAGVDEVDHNGMTALNLAVTRFGRVIVDMLLGHGASLSKGDKEGFTPLHAVSRGKGGQKCAYLLAKGAPPNALSRFGTSALHCAAESNSVASSRLLIGAGLQSNDTPGDARPDYLTPFQTAVNYNALDVVLFMVQECGEDIEQHTVDGRTMFELAEDRDGKTVFELLSSMRTQKCVLDGLPFDGSSAETQRQCGPAL